MPNMVQISLETLNLLKERRQAGESLENVIRRALDVDPLVKRRGRPLGPQKPATPSVEGKYSVLDKIVVGETAVFAWELRKPPFFGVANGEALDKAVARAERRTGFKFRKANHASGLHVTRVS